MFVPSSWAGRYVPDRYLPAYEDGTEYECLFHLHGQVGMYLQVGTYLPMKMEQSMSVCPVFIGRYVPVVRYLPTGTYLSMKMEQIMSVCSIFMGR